MNAIDKKILGLLQADGTLTVDAIAERVGLSKTPCWRRIQRLHESGAILRVVALLDAKRLNVATTVFVTLKTSNHSLGWLEKFRRAAGGIPEIMEIHRMSGDVDYLLRIAVPDISGYDSVYKRLIAAADLADVSASFVLETLHSTTALPLAYVPADRAAAD
jgi:Lrp/AsnC family transcriptional regulator